MILLSKHLIISEKLDSNATSEVDALVSISLQLCLEPISINMLLERFSLSDAQSNVMCEVTSKVNKLIACILQKHILRQNCNFLFNYKLYFRLMHGKYSMVRFLLYNLINYTMNCHIYDVSYITVCSQRFYLLLDIYGCQ